MNSDQNQMPQEKKLYDDSHTIISRIINRHFYNSIGEEGFEIIAATSEEAFLSYLNSTEIILSGIKDGNVGYVMGIMQKA